MWNFLSEKWLPNCLYFSVCQKLPFIKSYHKFLLTSKLNTT
ncbi:hypothetical protein T06_9246 [Trichinella sp. T6]|nr:hypothetical protein T06_9246 [Trichinella sp. T6]